MTHAHSIPKFAPNITFFIILYGEIIMNNLPDYIIDDLNGPYFAWKPAKDEPFRPTVTCLFYLRLGKRRSYKLVADYFKLSLKTIERYGLKYNWQERSYHFDKMIFLLNKNKSYIDWEKQQEALFDLKVQYSSVAFSSASEIMTLLEFSEFKYKDDRAVQRLAFIKNATFTLKNIFKMTDFKPPESILQNNTAINQLIKQEFGIEDPSSLKTEKDYVHHRVEFFFFNESETFDEKCFRCRYKDDPESLHTICKTKRKEKENQKPNNLSDDESLDNEDFSVKSKTDIVPIPEDQIEIPTEIAELKNDIEKESSIEDNKCEDEDEDDKDIEEKENQIDLNDFSVWRDPKYRDRSNDPDDPDLVAALDEDYNRWVISEVC